MSTKKSRLITIHNLDWIAPLSMYGPIVSPRYFDEDLVRRLVNKGYNVTEYPTPVDAPRATVKSIKLTNKNFNDYNRFNPSKKDITLNNQKDSFIGVPADGTATAINPIATDTPVQVDDSNAIKIPKTDPIPANVIPNGLSKNERKRLARAQREAEAAARAKAMEDASVPEDTEVLTDNDGASSAPVSE